MRLTLSALPHSPLTPPESRIVNRAVGERSFHVFYQILKGASAAELKEVHLEKDIAKYNYLALSKCVTSHHRPHHVLTRLSGVRTWTA